MIHWSNTQVSIRPSIVYIPEKFATENWNKVLKLCVWFMMNLLLWIEVTWMYKQSLHGLPMNMVSSRGSDANNLWLSIYWTPIGPWCCWQVTAKYQQSCWLCQLILSPACNSGERSNSWAKVRGSVLQELGYCHMVSHLTKNNELTDVFV